MSIISSYQPMLKGSFSPWSLRWQRRRRYVQTLLRGREKRSNWQTTVRKTGVRNFIPIPESLNLMVEYSCQYDIVGNVLKNHIAILSDPANSLALEYAGLQVLSKSNNMA